MDSLLVDLDKVLDDLEAEENEAPGNEKKPSGFHEFLEKSNEQTYKVIDSYIPVSDSQQYDVNNVSQTPNNLQNICYDFPYEPETFDMSEADFAPSPNLGDSGYNGSLSYTNYNDSHKGIESFDQGTRLGNQSANSTGGSNFTLQNGNDLTDKNILSGDSGVIKNDLQPGKFKLTYPVQADISPMSDRAYYSGEMNGFGSYKLTETLLPKQANIDRSSEQTAVRQVSVQSFTSIDSKSDPDKYPVQCNTPQTPKENMFSSPLDSQISSSSLIQNGGAVHNSSQDSMQDGHSSDHKLANLKEDISDSLTVKGYQNVDKNVFMNSSNSLPASFHASLNKQSDNHSSLPLNLSNGEDSGVLTVEDNKPYCNGDIGEHFDTDETEFSDQVKNQEKIITEQVKAVAAAKDHSLSGVEPKAVGFVDDDGDVDDMDEYLRDVEMTDGAVTEQMAQIVKPNTSNDGLIGNNSSAMINKDYDVTLSSNNQMVDQQYEPVTRGGLIPKDSLIADVVNNVPNIPVNMDTNQKVSQFKDVVQVLPVELNSAVPNVPNPQTVISNPETSISPSTLVSIDSGLASMNDNVLDSGSFPSPVSNVPSDMAARPKVINHTIDSESGMSGLAAGVSALTPSISPTSEEFKRSENSESNLQSELYEPSESELKHEIDTENQVTIDANNANSDIADANTTNNDLVVTALMDESCPDQVDLQSNSDTGVNLAGVELRRPQISAGGAAQGVSGRPRSWSPSDSGQPPVQKQKRPTSLNLPPLPQINLTERSLREEDSQMEDLGAAEAGVNTEAGTEDSATGTETELDIESLEGAVGGEEIPYIPPESIEEELPPSYGSTLGIVAPKWIPDAEAPVCMSCDARFTFTKRRHHCRACGKVFCSSCCNMKARLIHLKNQEARVCVQCHRELTKHDRVPGAGAQRGPHPNNPGDYSSVVPGQPAAAGGATQQPPSVLVPVLKRDGGNRRSEPKQVMFSDGIRPGGDLTELDGSSEITRLPPRRTRVQKRVERVSSGGHHSSRSRRVRSTTERTFECFIPAEGLPPLLVPKPDGIGFDRQDNPDLSSLMTQIKDEQSPPVIFAINSNLQILVKIINLDCCVNKVVWCFTTRGMPNVGQEEIVTILETFPDEASIPRDIFSHLNAVYEDASKGNPVTELGHTLFNQSFLDSREHGGFLYIRSTFQCTQKLILPHPPYLFGILLQKWETPWAKVFPIRLLLRLGAEYRYYPCPLIGVRNRKPVFFEIGHTIMNLLADFRNYQYMLPNIKGITIHMEDKVTKINFPRNTYEDLMKVVNNSNEHVMAVAANFSPDADSHLVCIQNDDGNYQTQAINIQNKPRKVTGASFVVFNGALKTSSGLTAKSSIVEDGLMVQITPDSMMALKQSMKDMRDYTITCALIGAPKPDETVIVQWIDDDKNINIGVKSPIDGMSMDGIESLRIQNSVDYIGEHYCIRWTEVFFIQTRGGSVKWEPVDLSRLGETLATAFCVALTPHLQGLKDASLTRIGLRVTLGADNVGYEAGAAGERLPDVYMNDLDNELIPVIHRATQADGSIVLEMIFQVID